VSKKSIVEKRAVAGVDDSDTLKTSVNNGIHKDFEEAKGSPCQIRARNCRSSSQCDTLIDVAKRIGEVNNVREASGK
jgi:hypothetical protein